MKLTDKKYMQLLAIGLLVMSAGTIVNYFIEVNDDIVDFFKGLGITLVFGGFWLLVNSKRHQQDGQL